MPRSSTSLTSLDPTRLRLPEKPALEGLEAKWMPRWEEERVYRFERGRRRAEVFFSRYPAADRQRIASRGPCVLVHAHRCHRAFQRMRGKDVFYPMGWDDNGLPTERRVQNYYGVRCDPSLPHDPAFEPPEKPGKQPISISRPNFVELCNRLTTDDEKAFEHLWRYLGLSVDWSMTYATISPRAQRVSQVAFLHLLQRGWRSARSPDVVDVDFKTAVAQAELEDRELSERTIVRFAVGCRCPDPPGRAARPRPVVEIETTRPELIPPSWRRPPIPISAVPGFVRSRCDHAALRRPRPIKAHPLADPEKGASRDDLHLRRITDVTWWRELSLPVRAVIQPDGTLRQFTGNARGNIDAGRAGLVRSPAAFRGEGAHRDRGTVRGRRSRRYRGHHACRQVLREGAIGRSRS